MADEPRTDKDPGGGESDETDERPLTDSDAHPPQQEWGEGPDDD